eukprot:CAMPEP_0168343758 /NCGR_PEP_ID=MMETSP0213-20121227/16341_1 /TAXON_ID=151035 /ORGANISM="Euplotes harpa, Strain FSP1.4" /LENGTH=138 /DNA_ID=CAMNT_0008351229 /DNA_START=78 /DNA_END=494 /DNA_ORIENTATION=+
MNISYAWLLVLLYPIAIVPYTYVTSFFFNDEAAAQNFTIIHNFLIGGLLPIIMNVLRMVKSTKTLGDVLIWFPRFLPIYDTCNGILTISLKDTIATMRKESAPEALSFKAAGGDVMFLCLEFVFYIVVIVIIELGLLN